MEAAGGGGWHEMGAGVVPSSSSAPSYPVCVLHTGDCYPMSDAYRMEEVGEDGGGRFGVMVSSLSCRTCSSAPSSPRSVRSLSIDLGDIPPMSEWEEIASRRWLQALESPDTRESHPTPAMSARREAEAERKTSSRRSLQALESPDTRESHPTPAFSARREAEAERKPSSRRWLLPPFLPPRFAFAAETDGGGDAWRKHKEDPLLSYRDLGRYAFGDFSMAVVQANTMRGDQCQLESGPFGAFVGVYDGHPWRNAAQYVCDHLYRRFREISSGVVDVKCEDIEAAFLQTDEGFITMVVEMLKSNPRIATIGTCCIVGVICQQILYVANLGDSRVVLGAKSGNTSDTVAIQLSAEHRARVQAGRQELKAQHPDDRNIVVLRQGVLRIKGIIQVSRSISNAYMKRAEYNREPIHPRFRIPEPMNIPILSAEPMIIRHHLRQNDRFLIFASDGLWKNLSNQEAVDIVHNHPHAGAARRLLKAALQEAARKRGMKYSQLKQYDMGVGRDFHDDITIIVLFLDHDLVTRDSAQAPSLSIRSPVRGLYEDL